MKMTMRWAVIALLMTGCIDLEASHYRFDSGVLPSSTDCTRRCEAPPRNKCIDASTLQAYPTFGVCSATSGCAYTAVAVTCASGCANGACIDEPCAGLFCDHPAAASCVDGQHLKVFSSRGQCTAGQCSYTSVNVACPGGCSNGVCAGNACAGVSCRQPPQATCIASNVLRTFEAQGACTGAGNCSYAQRDVTCSGQCQNDSCTDQPCAGTSCGTAPVSTCPDESTVRSYENTGTCLGSTGLCAFTATDTPCGQGLKCQGGQCIAPPQSCTVASCNDGCCRGSTCVRRASQNGGTCGLGAEACAACETGLDCSGGQCVDACAVANGGCDRHASCSHEPGGARTCTCKPGYVGDGRTCTLGSSDAGTLDAGVNGCNRVNCPFGCCSGSLCLPGSTANSCGDRGAACKVCSPGSTCSGRACVACPGCIDLSTGQCRAGTDVTGCGQAGAFCQACDVISGQTCSGGVCTGGATCNSTTCRDGCCDGNTCISRTRYNDFQCGSGTSGTACISCNGTCDVDAGVCANGPSSTDGGGLPGFTTCTTSADCPGMGNADGLCCDSGAIVSACRAAGEKCYWNGSFGRTSCNAVSHECE